MAFDIELIKKDDILKVWGEVAHYAENLERRSHGRYVTADILHQLLELPYFVWIVRENGNALGFFIQQHNTGMEISTWVFYLRCK